MHSMQAGYMEKAQKYTDKAFMQIEKLRSTFVVLSAYLPASNTNIPAGIVVHVALGLLTSWQHFSAFRRLLKLWLQIENSTPSIDACLLEEHSCQITSQCNLRRQSPRLFLYTSPQQEKSMWVAILDQFKLVIANAVWLKHCEN